MKNCHISHIEDLLISEADANTPIEYLQSMIQFIKGIKSDNVKVSVKWDGAPAFVCGKHPENGKFFVGTKSVFSGKVCYTESDINYFYEKQQDLAKILKDLLQYLSHLEWPGVFQGDLLWTEDLVTFDKDGFWFHPNCLRYYFPIQRYAKIGVVLHTTYIGETLKDMEAQFGAQTAPNYVSDDVFIFEPSINIKFADVTMKMFWLNLTAKKINDSPEILKILKSLQQPKVFDLFCRYVNNQVKMVNVPSAEGFLKFIEDRYAKHIETLKTLRNKEKMELEKCAIIRSIIGLHFYYLHIIFHFYLNLIEVKNQLISYLDKQEDYQITLPDGTNCGHEGYVLSIDNKTVKFVNRGIFSKANFNMKRDWK